MNDSRLLVPLCKTSDDLPLVLVLTGEAGHCMSFKPLAKRLKNNWQLVGLLHPRFIDDTERFQSLPELAARFRGAIGTVKRALIFGHSLGGALGYELAGQLRDADVDVGLVVFDTQMRSLHTRRNPMVFRMTDRVRQARDILTPIFRPGYFKTKMHAWDAARNMRQYHPLATGIPISLITPHEPYARSAFLPEPNLGWDKVGKVIHTEICAGDHWTAYRPPHAVEFAQCVHRGLSALHQHIQ